jgi:hypothetical protein
LQTARIVRKCHHKLTGHKHPTIALTTDVSSGRLFTSSADCTIQVFPFAGCVSSALGLGREITGSCIWDKVRVQCTKANRLL